MALNGEMKKGKLFLLFFSSFFFLVSVCDGTKEKKFEHLVEDFKGESDKVASEIYAWIDKHSKGLQSHGYIRHQSHDHINNPRHPKRYNKENMDKLIKTLKGESDHLANEIYAWIDKHRKGFLPRGKSRGQLRHHLRSRRSIEKRSSNSIEGESIQDVMLDLMNAPHPKEKRHENRKVKKKTKKNSKRKVVKKTKHAASKRSSKKESKKNKIKKQVKPVLHSKKSKISRKKKTSSAHVIKAFKKSGGLANLLKMISADPSKKIVVTKGKNDVTLDQKSLKFFNKIPKSLLQKFIENVELNKFFNIDTYISGEKGKGYTKSKVGKTSKKRVAKKKILKKNGEKERDVKGSGSGTAIESSAEEEKKNSKIKAVKVKKLSRKGKKKSRVQSKKAKKLADKGTKKTNLRKAKKIEEHAASKSKVVQLAKTSKGLINGKKKQKMQGKPKGYANIGHQKLAELKEKIKKTNSLKFKVAKALLEHCETQNKLKQVFDNVNASLKEASHLAKAIGKKFGIEKSDLDKLTTKHTEDAVQEFLNKIF